MSVGRPFARGSACICEWDHGCGGLGVLRCAGCGGDQCVCVCGGQDVCNGCPDCGDYDGDVWGEYLDDVRNGGEP